MMASSLVDSIVWSYTALMFGCSVFILPRNKWQIVGNDKHSFASLYAADETLRMWYGVSRTNNNTNPEKVDHVLKISSAAYRIPRVVHPVGKREEAAHHPVVALYSMSFVHWFLLVMSG